jgi:hypothetical protein
MAGRIAVQESSRQSRILEDTAVLSAKLQQARSTIESEIPKLTIPL